MQNLQYVLEQLQKEQKSLAAEHEKAKAKASSIGISLRKINKAIATLKGDSRPKRPTVTTDDVVKVLKTKLATGPLKVEAAKKLVYEKLAESGKSRNGIALRFKKAISMFSKNGDVLSLSPPSMNEGEQC